MEEQGNKIFEKLEKITDRKYERKIVAKTIDGLDKMYSVQQKVFRRREQKIERKQLSN